MDRELLRQYAELVVNVGVNIQKGQKAVINCPVECAEFARLMTTAAYDAGASDVFLNWRDDYITREKLLKADDGVFDSVYPWDAQKRYDLVEDGAAFISVAASDPENLRGVDPGRLSRAEAAAARDANTREARRRMMANWCPWCVVSVPIPSWAKKVFPSLPDGEALEALWDSIFSAVRIRKGGDAVAEWREHCRNLESKAKGLTSLGLRKLHYVNSLGTDLTVEMPEGHIWLAGGDTAKSGIRFVANMPTEEVFSAPKRDGLNGVLYASKPLVIHGNIVEDIRFTFKDGRITEISASSNGDILRKEVETDEGAHYIGEIALVPYDSPISRSGILFYNTLFDENAACHFAYGEAYPSCVEDGDSKSAEELLKAGINADSSVHTDFMVGTEDLSITGTTADGRTVSIFENGNFSDGLGF